MKTKYAYLAGGCFWGMEDLFRNLNGVVDTEVGYLGGQNENPTYEYHPGHAEGIEIEYNPSVVSFKQLLDFFYRIHNPTLLNQQGNDRGSSYRSAIFYQNETERNDAQEVIDLVDESGFWGAPITTTLEKFDRFYSAEEYHQDYLVKNPNGYTCHSLRTTKPFLTV